MTKKIFVLALLINILGYPRGAEGQHNPDHKPITLAFVAGVTDDPFYITVLSGLQQGIADVMAPVELITETPALFAPHEQIPLIDKLIERGGVDYLLVAPTDREELIPVLEKAYAAGMQIITVDTFIGDGDYQSGNVTFPIMHIGSDNYTAGFRACQALASNLGEGASIYIQHAGSGISTVDQREVGCSDAAYIFGLDVAGVEYNEDDPQIAFEQTTAALDDYPNLGGIFGTNYAGAQGAGLAVQQAGLEGQVKVVAIDATTTAMKLLDDGVITDVLAQKPYDMGYLAAALAVAHAQGYESIPKRLPVDYVLINAENMHDPAITSSVYSSQIQELQAPLDDLQIGFVPGVDQDPFFLTMTRGVFYAAEVYGVEVVREAPEHFWPSDQIPIIERLLARGEMDYLITAPTDVEELIPILQHVDAAGIPVITVDTFIGDGDYEAGSVTFPLTYIGSDNWRGGYIGCSQLAMADILGTGAKIYIQNVRVGISTTDQRALGCQAAADDFGLEVVAMDYSNNVVEDSVQQTIAVLSKHPDIVGIFGTNVFSAQGAGTAVQEVGLDGMVEVVAFDSTEFAIDLLYQGTVTQVIAQKPADMGYFAVLSAVAQARGVHSIPKRWPTGYEVIHINNVEDPDIARFIYRENQNDHPD